MLLLYAPLTLPQNKFSEKIFTTFFIPLIRLLLLPHTHTHKKQLLHILQRITPLEFHHHHSHKIRQLFRPHTETSNHLLIVSSHWPSFRRTPTFALMQSFQGCDRKVHFGWIYVYPRGGPFVPLPPSSLQLQDQNTVCVVFR